MLSLLRSISLPWVAAIGLVPLVACDVGPHYAPPKLEIPAAFKEVAPSGPWTEARPQDAALKGKWWEIFNEPELNRLEEQLTIDNQTIAQYFQNFMAARAQVNEARAGYFPTVTVAPSATRTGAGALAAKSSGGGASVTTGSGTQTVAARSGTYSNEFALPFEATWEPDLWGRIRETVHEYQYAAQVSAADLENERLTEQAALATYYFELRGQDSLQNLYNRTIDADRNSLQLTQALADTGIDNDEAVAEAEVTLRNAEATAIGIATNRAVYEHAIAMLIGQPASQFSLPVKGLGTPVPAIPIAIPSEMLQRRPDVAAAERTMAEANALIGVEVTAFYPTLSLTASGGLQSPNVSQLFSAPALLWSLGSSASETLFDGGLRSATVAQYKASYEADVASYRQTVLTAFQQVEDEIATLRILSQQIASQADAVKAAERYVNVATAQYETGLDPYLNVMTAETTLLGDQQTLVTLRVNQMAAAVSLVQDLGGGWDVKQLPDASSIAEAP